MGSPGINPQQPQDLHTAHLSPDQQHALEHALKQEGIKFDPKDLKNLNNLKTLLKQLPGGEQKFEKLMKEISSLSKGQGPLFQKGEKLTGTPTHPPLSPESLHALKQLLVQKFPKEGAQLFDSFKELYQKESGQALPNEMSKEEIAKAQHTNQVNVLASVVGSKSRAEELIASLPKRIDAPEGLGGISSSGTETGTGG